ncbi:hypothetical protein ARAM_006116 [Aspergillus rambellii]|uniref:DUF7514 domain-containing protein n=1 Tax=Aspergillus rambellii TaxID=308745 RepID=A0A0F8U8X1_9EURO|nr:hypothetical protein ARAM_006116 [Aspergillus rambellii]
MAYDAFQNGSNPFSQPENPNTINITESHPSSFSPPYPFRPSSDQINMPAPPDSAPPQGYYPDPLCEQTNWAPPAPPPPPPPASQDQVNEEVTPAMGNSGTGSYISPELLSQITATVIQQLRAAGFESGLGNNQQPPQPPPQLGSPYPPPVPPHPAQGDSTSPPPPQIIAEEIPPSPRPATEPAAYPPPPPPPETSAHLDAKGSPTPAQERRESPVSQMSNPSQKTDNRPNPPVRGDTFPTTLEKIWGKLFEDGKPTERLGQFLRGIAMHLIENFPPGNTLVVTPEKLQRFYADTDVPSDPYPWQDIFDDRTSSISRLFREVEAEHHLVQDKLNERPDIPGLTPRGFQVWATLMIQTHPDKEFERLQKAVLHMPISNPDNRKERFPKEIPRRLFPETPDLRLREKVDEYIMKHCGVDLPPITDDEISKVAAYRHKASASPNVSIAESTASINERERKPYSSTSAVFDDDDTTEPSRPAIERKRKPYTAQPGGGKVHEGPETPTHHHTGSFSSASGIREGRVTTITRVPGSPTFRSGSRGARSSTAHRSRSQSRGFHAGHEYRHSESDLVNNSGSRTSGIKTSGDYYYSSPTSTRPNDLLDDNRQYRDHEGDHRPYESLRGREKEREKIRYQEGAPQRSSWVGEDDEGYYRGMLGGQGGGPANSGYDYKTYR